MSGPNGPGQATARPKPILDTNGEGEENKVYKPLLPENVY